MTTAARARYKGYRFPADIIGQIAAKIARSPLTRNRWFESCFLHRRVSCELEDDIDIPVPRGSTITDSEVKPGVFRAGAGLE